MPNNESKENIVIEVVTIAVTISSAGDNTGGSAAKVINFDRLGKKVRPGTLGEIKVGQREHPKSPSVKTQYFIRGGRRSFVQWL